MICPYSFPDVLQRYGGEGEVCRDVARGDLPPQLPGGREAVERAGGDVVLGVADIDVARLRVDCHPVGYLDLPVRPVGDEVARHHLLPSHVVEGVGDGVALRHVAPLHGGHVERVAHQAHLAGRDVQAAGYAVGLRVDHIDVRLHIVVVAARRDVDAPVAVERHPVQVDGDVDGVVHGERPQVHHGHGRVVVRIAVAAGVGDVELSAGNDHLLGLVADDDLPGDFQARGVHLDDLARTGVRVNLHGTGIRADVRLAVVEDDVAAVEHVDAAHVPPRVHVHHLDVVRAVDDGVELAAVDGDVVAHIAQLLDNPRVARGVDVALVLAGPGVEEVERRLVAAHVALVEEEEPTDVPVLHRLELLFLAVEEGDVAPAACQQAEQEQHAVSRYLSHVPIGLFGKVRPGSERILHDGLDVRARHGVAHHHLVLLVEEVVHLQRALQRAPVQRDVPRHGEVARVPRQDVVRRDVRPRRIAFAGIDEAVVRLPAPPVCLERCRPAVARDVGNLSAIVGVVGVGEVLRPLEGVVQARRQRDTARQQPVGLCRHVDAAYLHLAQVDHRPAEEVRRGHGDNLVLHLVIVDVRLCLHAAQPTAAERACIGRADVVLAGELRVEADVADERVVQVVEGRHAEDALVEGACGPLVRQPPCQHGSRGPLVAVFSGSGAALHPLGDERAQHARLQVHPSHAERGRGSHQSRVPARIDEVHQVGVEGVHLVVRREADVPAVRQGIALGGGEVQLPLVVVVVDVHQCRVAVGVGEVVQIVVGIFGIEQQAVAREVLLVGPLGEGVHVPLTVLVAELVLHHGARVAALGAVEVRLRPPVAPWQGAEEPPFEPHRLHVAVAPHRRGVVAVGDAVGEAVTPRGVEVFAAERRAQPVGELAVPHEGGIDGAEGAALERRLQVLPLALAEEGRPRLQVDAPGGAEVLGGLEDGALLSVVERHRLHVVEREASQVHHAVLRVAQLDAVVEHAHMVRPHAADVHGLESAHPSVVLDLHAGEVADGIGDTVRPQALQSVAGQPLCRDDLLHRRLCLDDHFVEPLQAVEAALCPCRRKQPRARHEKYTQPSGSTFHRSLPTHSPNVLKSTNKF